MRLYFVRHGESEANLLREFSNRGLKHGLTDKGRVQAFELAAKLQWLTVTKIYTSPLLRAVQTAEILAQKFGIVYTITDALREYDCGVLEGKSDPESWQLYDSVLQDWLAHARWDQRIEGGESFLALQARFVPLIEHLVDAHQLSNDGVILVGHGGLYRCMLPLVLTNLGAQFGLSHHLSNAEYVVAELQANKLVCLTWGEQQI